MNTSIEEKNKALVLEAFEAAFNRRDPAAYDRYWSPNYLQHSAHIPAGREGLRNLIVASEDAQVRQWAKAHSKNPHNPGSS
jgi:predicted SnoaL-like aldol condensation-catalyzing enzyme